MLCGVTRRCLDPFLMKKGGANLIASVFGGILINIGFDGDYCSLSACQCPLPCQHVKSRARWTSVAMSCCSAALKKAPPPPLTPGRNWTLCRGCRTTPCKVLQTSWPSECPFAPTLLVNVTHTAELRLRLRSTISATCPVPGPPLLTPSR